MQKYSWIIGRYLCENAERSRRRATYLQWPMASLVVQWTRLCLPMLGHRLEASGRFHVLQILKPLRPRAGAPQEERPLPGACAPQLERSPRSPQLERARKQQRTPRTAENTHTHSQWPSYERHVSFLSRWTHTEDVDTRTAAYDPGKEWNSATCMGGWESGNGVPLREVRER